MRLFRFLRPISSAPVACQRLQILLGYERNLVSQTDLIAVLHQEILGVIGRHIPIDQDQVQIKVDRGADAAIITVDIEIPNTSLATASFWAHSGRTQTFANNVMRWSR
jgi:cell division topological specificity factor